LIVRCGAYGEHVCDEVTAEGKALAVGGSEFRVLLAAGAGGRLTLKMKRYAATPSLAPPWK
jgi:hypothetical protein